MKKLDLRSERPTLLLMILKIFMILRKISSEKFDVNKNARTNILSKRKIGELGNRNEFSSTKKI